MKNLLIYHPRFIASILLSALLVTAGVIYLKSGGHGFPSMPGNSPAEMAHSAMDHAGSSGYQVDPKSTSDSSQDEVVAALDEAIQLRLKAAIEAYSAVQGILGRDSITDLNIQSVALKAALESALEGAPAGAEELRGILNSTIEASHTLSSSKDLATARSAFALISEPLLKLIARHPQLQNGYSVFQCPMTDGFNLWIQREGEKLNPYRGQAMSQCGSSISWANPILQGAAPPKTELADQSEHQGHEHAADGIAYYTCPMHSSVKQSGPGQCPICGMTLTPVNQKDLETGTILVDDAKRQRIGVKTEAAKIRSLKSTLRAVGTVRYDETRLTDVNLRMSGWIQHLSVNQTGQKVKAGQTLFQLYSPEVYAAQLEYLNTYNRSIESGPTNSPEMFASLLRSSRQRLKLLGLSEGHIKAIENSKTAQESIGITSPASGYIIEKNIVDGARVEAGAQVYRIADLSQIWIDADIYEEDLSQVKLGQTVKVEFPYANNRIVPAKIDYLYPSINPQNRSGKARIVLKNTDFELKPDMFANVLIEIDIGKRLSIPESAVIYTGSRRLVFIDLGEGRLQPKLVELGVHIDGYYEVKSGLSEGDIIISSGNFLIAAESRIHSVGNFWSQE